MHMSGDENGGQSANENQLQKAREGQGGRINVKRRGRGRAGQAQGNQPEGGGGGSGSEITGKVNLGKPNTSQMRNELGPRVAVGHAEGPMGGGMEVATPRGMRKGPQGTQAQAEQRECKV